MIETHSAGLFHACTSLLNQFDQCQDNFLNKFHCNAAAAFLNNNFVPLTLRRNIAVLGLIHKRVLGLAHPAFSNVMPWDTGTSPEEYHDKQLYDHSAEVKSQRGLYNRSIFGMIAEYNRLPQYVVNSQSVTAFQHELTKIAKARCKNGMTNWRFTFDLRYRGDADQTDADTDILND